MMKFIEYYLEQAIEKVLSVRKYIYSSIILTCIFFILQFFNIYSCSWLVLCLPIGVMIAYFVVVLLIYIFSYLISILLD